jgi:hypothetical protein
VRRCLLLSLGLWSQRASDRHSKRSCDRQAGKPSSLLACPIVAANPVRHPRPVHIDAREAECFKSGMALTSTYVSLRESDSLSRYYIVPRIGEMSRATSACATITGHPNTIKRCPLLGAKRTSRFLERMSAYDPKRTCGGPPGSKERCNFRVFGALVAAATVIASLTAAGVAQLRWRRHCSGRNGAICITVPSRIRPTMLREITKRQFRENGSRVLNPRAF